MAVKMADCSDTVMVDCSDVALADEMVPLMVRYSVEHLATLTAVGWVLPLVVWTVVRWARQQVGHLVQKMADWMVHTMAHTMADGSAVPMAACWAG